MINQNKKSEEAAVDKEEYGNDMTFNEFFKIMSDEMMMAPENLPPDMMVVVSARKLARITNLILIARSAITNSANHHLLPEIAGWVSRDVSSFMKSVKSIQHCLDEHEEYLFGELMDNE